MLTATIFLSTQALARGAFVPTASEQKIAEEIVSVFENGTPKIQYRYAEKLDDSSIRGITFGRSGFTSCQDGYQVLSALKAISPAHALLQYLPVMASSASGAISCSSSVRRLMDNHFIEKFIAAGANADIKSAQDLVYQRRYLQPALRLMQTLRLNHFVSFVVLLDAYIQHGEGDGGEGIDAIIKRSHHSPEQTDVDELLWIQSFLDARKVILENGDDEWRKSTGRVEILKQIVSEHFDSPDSDIKIRSIEYGNFDLTF